MRYGVAFNGALAQTIAFSGMLTDHWEFGTGISISYSSSHNENIYQTYRAVADSNLSVTETSGVKFAA